MPGRVTDLKPPVFANTIFAIYDADTDTVRFGMDLSDYKPYECADNCKTCNDDLECSECKVP